MNLNADPKTVQAVAKVFQLASILDDRAAQPDKARIAAWAEMVERHKLTECDLLDGLQAYYDKPSDRAIQIGDLIHHARQVRRDRNEREAEAERERRATALEVKAADDVKTIAAGFVPGPVENKTDRLTHAQLWLQTCNGRKECQEAIREYCAAKSEARKSA